MDMLLPILYCTMFFALPLIGMIVLALQKMRRGANGEAYLEEIYEESRENKIHIRTIFPKLKSNKIIDYQFIESQIHEPLHFRKHKGRAPCRAGP